MKEQGLTPQEIEEKLNTVLASNPDNSRLGTYAQALYCLPEGTLNTCRRILEVGANGNLLKFRGIFRHDIELFGITLDPEHAQSAIESGEQNGIKTHVVIHNIDNGLPEGFTGMDLVLDIFSSTHYAEEDPLPKLAHALKPGGVLAFVNGDIFSGLGDFARKHPELDGRIDVMGAAFRHTVGEETFLYISIQQLVVMLQETAYPNLPQNPTEKDIVACLDDIARIAGHPVVTNQDLGVVSKVKKLENLGLVDINHFGTNDGIAWVARKSDL
ncbi:MAG: class I SAM-dependent methyltransferase [Candidatus Curtissbacteria bacterium]|nr:class I SAM-dependent methyltransferase [Candidatus Curtissbacteria bacterium]